MNTKNYSTPTKKYKSILSAVHMVYRLTNSTYNVQELSLRLTRLLCQFIKASGATVYILDTEKKRVRLKAIFDNKINILINKRNELNKLSDDEKRVLHGFPIFDELVIGVPLVADDNVGAIFVQRLEGEPAFSKFDKEILSVIAEQSVTAIRNLQLYEQQQKVILESIRFIGKLLEKHGYTSVTNHLPVYFKIMKAMAEKLNMSQNGIDSLYYASVLRDAGAVDVPYEILAKTSQLTSEEFKVIRNQPTKSAELIRPVEFLRPVLPIILYHHENYDGSGYPSGLRKEQIPLGARIMSVVNAFEAMVKKRPYKKTLSVEEAIQELQNNSGTQFDPKVVDAFVKLSKQKKFRKLLSYNEM
jgi:hypothetical protein